MPQYTLELDIDPKDLALINASQMNIVLAQGVNGSQGNVAWQSFSPFEENIVTWDEQYGIYASTTAVQNNAVILKMSEVYPAEDAAVYPFTSQAVFGVPNGGGAKGSYEAVNGYTNTSYLTFGLCQSAQVNGTTTKAQPINAASVISQMHAQFTPYVTIYVWLQANITSGTVTTVVTGQLAEVTFGGDVTSHTLVYDAATGGFINGSNAKASLASRSGRSSSTDAQSGITLRRRTVS